MTTHVELQDQVVQLAGLYRWRHLHVRRSIGKGRRWVTATNLVGWPDLLLMRPDQGWVAAELKIPPDKASAEQDELLGYLGSMPSCRAFLWTPADWDQIQATLAVPVPSTLSQRWSPQ